MKGNESDLIIRARAGLPMAHSDAVMGEIPWIFSPESLTNTT